jgi:hypothetical protein
VAEGRVLGLDGRPLVWEPTACVLPVSPQLAERVSGTAYEQAVAEAAGRFAFRLLAPAAEAAPARKERTQRRPGLGRRLAKNAPGPGRRPATRRRG